MILNDQIIERIQKLLSLANSDNENEAQLAASKANELLTKYNLSLQEVEGINLEYSEHEVATQLVGTRSQEVVVELNITK